MVDAPETISTPTSSNIERVSYFLDIITLEVEFKNGSTYQYFDFPANVWYAFKQAIETGESAGKFLNNQIKGKFRYSKV